jgi:hypothetical protein
VFDELSTVTLLDGSERINAKRFPNFAALADDATFYRDATTVHDFTEHAVPAILTGQLPAKDELPIYADHRQNLFTLLGNGYRLRVNESVTHLCPVELCRSTDVESVGERLSSLASDSAIVYLHFVLPERLARGLPPVDQTWRNFQGLNAADDGDRSATLSPCAPVCGLIEGFSAGEPGTLHYLHMQMPHIPWRYLPSGKHYAAGTRVIPGLTDDSWVDDRFLADQAYERYLHQLGYSDRALGIVLAGLHATGLYDRALFIVLADHGLTFEPGKPRRDTSESTLHDLAFMPLIVKLPDQEEGRVEDGLARTIDVVPTIADVLDIRIPWPVDGRSLLDHPPDTDGVVWIHGKHLHLFEVPLSQLVAERAETLRRWTGLFGDGGWDGLFKGGPHGDLVGRLLADLTVGEVEGASVELDNRELLDTYDPKSPLAPVYVTGRIEGVAPGQDLAVAVNGRLATTTRTFDVGGAAHFAVLVPEGALRPGSNEVDILVVSPGGSLERVQPAAPSLAF